MAENINLLICLNASSAYFYSLQKLLWVEKKTSYNSQIEQNIFANITPF